jgi:hypothetical protein
MTVYHISHKYLGKSPTLTPRVPETLLDGEEATTPRVCVCPSVENCYVAMLGPEVYHGVSAMHVYQADGSATVPAKGVPDSRATKERWFLEPVRFTYVGKLPTIYVHPTRTVRDFRLQLRNEVYYAMAGLKISR